MTNASRLKTRLPAAVALLLILAACMPVPVEQPGPAVQPSQAPTAGPTAPPAVTSTDVWAALLQATPFAYFTPLPNAAPSAIDGTYAKIDASWPQWWRCLRCADYRAAGGIWKLQFDKGVMRIFYEVNGWRSISSYTVSGDRLSLFNDPYCPEHTGEYRWQLEEGGLLLEPLNDACAFELRAENLSRQSWLACTAPGVPGCEATRSQAPAPVTLPAPLQVTVHGGDSRFFETPPQLFAHANASDTAPPPGISVSFAEESIPYGLQRVLWWRGDWIEVTFDETYTSMGVQFLGEGMIGWARVLFDGQEVWRGNTSEIWSKSGRHGGFVEVTGFDAGEHTLRVESLGFDYRPVTVASFGFRREGGVHSGTP